VAGGDALSTMKIGYQELRPMLSSRFRTVAVGLMAITAVVLLSVPVVGAISRLRSIPLGKGSATISWTGKGGVTPTMSSIRGSARGLAIVATGTAPKPPPIGNAAPGSTSVSLPATLPLADIKGTISGTPFSLDVTLKLSGLDLSSNRPVTFGTITGSFRGQSINGVLTGRRTSQTVSFRGTIGSDHVTGTITRVVHHGGTSTGSASFDVTR
jgi:hypothetical protein